MEQNIGFSGRVAKAFQSSEITPLLALLGFLLGVFAVMITPREEEPQINVTFANVFIAFPGASAKEVEELVSTPAEQVLSEIEGLEHIYSVSRPGLAVLTVQFKVGEDRTQAIVRLYNAVYSNQDWLPAGLGVAQPIIKPKGIDDVPIVTLTLWTQDPARGAHELGQVAHTIESELKRIPGTREIYTLGVPDEAVRILIDAAKMAAYNLSMDDLRSALQLSNTSRAASTLVNNNAEIELHAGAFLSRVDEVRQLVVGVMNNHPVYLEDVAEVRYQPVPNQQYSWFGTGPAASARGIDVRGEFPAVTLAIAKQPGTNAVEIANRIIERVEQLDNIFIPDGVEITVTRNYGETADAKSQQLIGKLVFATGFVILLVLFAIGWREALIVGLAVIITLAITLFASWAWGFTLNRVSLFALIFSIGILVDDAIVVVENIHRHIQLGQRSLLQAIPLAVDEVGGPTILATFTVIAALVPMAFVTGLMGPYMSPIPINASIGMLISLAVAFIVTPWLASHVLSGTVHASEETSEGRLYKLFQRLISPFLGDAAGRRRRFILLIGVLLLMLASVGLVVTKLVVLKMLPFDNKSEFQVVVDMPEGTPVEQTARVMTALAARVAQLPEVTDYQVYVGGASPINFNGLIRQYYLREGGHQGDIQVNLVAKNQRDRKSHAIASSLRQPLQAIAEQYDANVKIVEIPPGPPVMSPLVAEIYGLDYKGQLNVATQIRKIFENTADIIDIDDSIETPTPRIIIHVDRQQAALLGVSQQQIVNTLAAAMSGEDVSYLHIGNVKHPVPLRLEFSATDKTSIETLLSLKVRSNNGNMIPVSNLVQLSESRREQAIYHKDFLPVVFVTADMAGKLDSPLYGMAEIYNNLSETPLSNGQFIDQYLIEQPDNPYRYGLKWDGEWQVTYETFRDMGIAYSVGLILIYLLIVAQFRSYVLPLIIMAPIPLTIIGVMPGHALLGANFTATSMIGMIALAGIIVRNSILLVDFINQQVTEGIAFEEALIRASAVRAKPIALTGWPPCWVPSLFSMIRFSVDSPSH